MFPRPRGFRLISRLLMDIFRQFYQYNQLNRCTLSSATNTSILSLYLYIHGRFNGLLCLSLSFVLNYIVTWVLYQVGHRRVNAVKVPPAVPHWIPFLGSALEFAFNGRNFVASST